MSGEGLQNDRPGPGEGAIIFGIFLILAGACLALLGGSCTLVFASEFFGARASEPYLFWPLFLLSLAALGAGVGLIWLGRRLMKGPSAPPPA